MNHGMNHGLTNHGTASENDINSIIHKLMCHRQVRPPFTYFLRDSCLLPVQGCSRPVI